MEDMEIQNAGAAEPVEQPERPGPEPVKAFTQSEVDEIVQRRLDRERKKRNALLGDGEEFQRELLRREQAVLERELRATARERFQRTGLPGDACDLLRYDSQEDFERSYRRAVEILTPIRREAVEAAFKAGGRTPQRGSGGPGRDSIRDAFHP